MVLVFLKDAAHSARREYRLVGGAGPRAPRERLDPPRLVDAARGHAAAAAGPGRWRLRSRRRGGVFHRRSDTRRRPTEGDAARRGRRASAACGKPTVAPRRYDTEELPGDVREATTVYASVGAVREAVARADAAGGTAATAAWHAEPGARFLCSTFHGGSAGVRVTEDGVVVITVELCGDELGEASIAVGPEGTFARKISAGDTDRCVTASDARSFERVLKERLWELGGWSRPGSIGERSHLSRRPPAEVESAPSGRSAIVWRPDPRRTGTGSCRPGTLIGGETLGRSSISGRHGSGRPEAVARFAGTPFPVDLPDRGSRERRGCASGGPWRIRRPSRLSVRCRPW